MRQIDQTMQRRIMRFLDGELPAEEREQLERDLLKDPAARQWMDEVARVDADSAGALQAMVAGTSAPRASRWGFAAAAVAAGLVALLAIGFAVRQAGMPTEDGSPVAQVQQDPPDSDDPAAELQPPADAVYHHDGWSADADPPEVGDRRVNRRFMGVYDEQQQKIYLLQVDRGRTMIQPAGCDL